MNLFLYLTQVHHKLLIKLNYHIRYLVLYSTIEAQSLNNMWFNLKGAAHS